MTNSNSKHNINVFWFKRDLRLYDNDAFNAAIESEHPLLLIYIFEPTLVQDEHYSDRHWHFIKESVDDLNLELSKCQTRVVSFHDEVLSVFKILCADYNIQTIYSTEETGLDITYTRDKIFQRYCSENGLDWIEFKNGGVERAIKNRDNWRKQWYSYMNSEILKTELSSNNFLSPEFIEFKDDFPKQALSPRNDEMQFGGRREGLCWANSFFGERLQYYSEYISKPEMSRYGCSRLSPYFAWGCISIREIYQQSLAMKNEGKWKKQLNAFMARLRWQAHFIQKFEMEPRIEFEAFNKGYLDLEQPENKDFVKAWKEGMTGYPLVDASIRAVTQTGYINFRMRSMCVSFLVHHLFQHYSQGSKWLARQFLDFEPGIHYGQFQMQAGFTATNTIRVYNPTKNALDHDSDAVFIKRYVPELRNLPTQFAIEPWKMTTMEDQLYDFKLKVDYPNRIVDIKDTRKIALSKLYGKRKETITQIEKQRILDVHTLKRRFP